MPQGNGREIQLSLQCSLTIAFPVSHSSSMGVTRPKFQISLGTPMNPGWSAVSPRTTSCKSGKWWVWSLALQSNSQILFFCHGFHGETVPLSIVTSICDPLRDNIMSLVAGSLHVSHRIAWYFFSHDLTLHNCTWAGQLERLLRISTFCW